MTRRARPMLPPLLLLLALASCSVFQRDKGNEPPTLSISTQHIRFETPRANRVHGLERMVLPVQMIAFL